MAFLKVGGKPPAKKQRLYIMDIELPSGMRITKIGKSSGANSKERMLQINSSIFDKFRCTAKIKIKRDREVPADKVFEYETILHRFFSDCQYTTTHKWDGVTECFCVHLDDVVQAYEAVIDGMVPDHTYVAPDIKEEELFTKDFSDE